MISGKFFKQLFRKLLPNPLDRRLKKAAGRGYKKILIPWNRGLGDIPLGLYAIVRHVREFIPDAEITFMTRQDLADGFSLLDNVHVRVMPEWRRRRPYALPQDLSSYDYVLENPDPTYWVTWQLGKLVPQLTWNPLWNDLYEKFTLPDGCLGVHVHSETSYGYQKNWPIEKFEELFKSISQPILIFGINKTPVFFRANIIDLRGETTLAEMLSIIKNKCTSLLTPDSGILSLVYYLNISFPLHIVSLWADPQQGILKQNVASPNPLLTHLPLLSPNKQTAALISVDEVRQCLSIPFLKEQLQTLKKPRLPLTPLSSYKKSGNAETAHYGKKLIAQGKMGCLILAGGQGTRLSYAQPKALFPVTLIKHKTLLQFFCEKTVAASQESKALLPLAIMTSPLNHQHITSYLQENAFFGLQPSQVSFFSQEHLPFLDDAGNCFFERPGKLATGPDGNGHSLKLFFSSGISQKWKAEGVAFVNMIPIDNPLADPFDAELLGTLAASSAEIGIKAIQRHPHERVGILGLLGNKICIQEYSEMPQDSSSFTLGNTGLFCFTLSFIEKISSLSLPFHLARKKTTLSSTKEYWKFERFIFDLFSYATKIDVLVYPREEIYAPIKNSTGDKSLATAQQALLNFDRRTYEKITGLSVDPKKNFELSPLFYYPTAELLKAWEGKSLPPQDYINLGGGFDL